MRGFAVTAADNAIVAAAAKYRPEKPKKWQDQWFKDELGSFPLLCFAGPVRCAGDGHEASGVHYTFRRCGSGMAALGACAATENAGGRISEWRITRRIRSVRDRIPPWTQ
jgi:hypothetical protein